MRTLNHRGAQWVVVTHGAGPVWITSESKTFRLDPFPVDQVVNPIGSGDAMTSGIAWAVNDGREIVDSVCLGMAAAAQNVAQLDTGRLDLGLAENQQKQIACKSIPLPRKLI